MPNTYLSRTTGSPTNSYKGTFSAWIKKGDTGNSRQELITEYTDANNRFYIGFNSSDKLEIGSVQSSSWVIDFGYTRVFKDVNAWYHIVMAFDTTQSTASNRVKLYVNGVQETNIPGSPTYPSQNSSIAINSASKSITIGASRYGGVSGGFNGSMSHVHFIDGTAYDASYFGSTDSTTGEWKINTSPSVTYGNNGFFILKDGNTITDSSTNSNNFSLGGGTLTKTEDCPANVFATMNPLTSYYAGAWTFSNGNNTVNMATTSERYVVGTMGFSSGKWYWEQKYVSKSGSTFSRVGIESNINNTAPDQSTSGYGYRGETSDASQGMKVNNGTYTFWGDDYGVGDIIGCAVDMDNNKIYFSINGVWQESGDPTSGATGTGSAFTIIDPPSGFYFPKIGKEAADTGVWSFNFGNGYFGTTAVSSAGTNASGIGIFEYDVPTGYTALSTKGLNL